MDCQIPGLWTPRAQLHSTKQNKKTKQRFRDSKHLWELLPRQPATFGYDLYLVLTVTRKITTLAQILWKVFIALETMGLSKGSCSLDLQLTERNYGQERVSEEKETNCYFIVKWKKEKNPALYNAQNFRQLGHLLFLDWYIICDHKVITESLRFEWT